MTRESFNYTSPILSPKSHDDDIEISSLLSQDLLMDMNISPDEIVQTNQFAINLPICQILFVPRTRTVVTTQNINESPHELIENRKEPTSSLNCFEVELSTSHIIAFSIYEHEEKMNCGVVVRDGPYLRYGKIIRQISQEECRISAYQIIEFDTNNKLGDYIKRLTELVTLFTKSFIRSKMADVQLKEIEIVSYASRATVKISILNSDQMFEESLTRFLISIFDIAVEITE